MENNSILIIGHRGAGKTSFLNRLRSYFPTQRCVDLDEEIETRTGLSVSEVFKAQGEKRFRELELSHLSNLLQGSFSWISLGAGINLRAVRANFKNLRILWIRRGTDREGRIFNNRPRLNPNLPALGEYEERFKARDPIFAECANWIYEVPEGLTRPCEFEKILFSEGGDFSEASMTVTSEIESQFVDSKPQLFSRNFRFLELRSDGPVIKLAPVLMKKTLFSVRTKDVVLPLDAICDWALELGEPTKKVEILSLHERLEGESIKDLLQRFKSYEQWGDHLKLSPMVESFGEILEGIRWQQEAPSHRSFLPRSMEGRWQWVRLYLKGKQRINFVRQGAGSASDQPTMWQWLATPNKPERFAAVLGAPIKHSASPAFHTPFFEKHQMPFWAIDMKTHEWDQGISILQNLGLKAAAVTSPLKEQAGGNTLFFKENTFSNLHIQISNYNTDGIGLQGALTELFPNYNRQRLMVWGGGGVRSAITKVVPHGDFFSQRTGQYLRKKGREHRQYDILIWAGLPGGNKPSREFDFKAVFDLNYKENSLARELALEREVPYYSGKIMFELQAKEQQKIWETLLATF